MQLPTLPEFLQKPPAVVFPCGEPEVFGPGGNFFVPAGQEHAATGQAGYQTVDAVELGGS